MSAKEEIGYIIDSNPRTSLEVRTVRVLYALAQRIDQLEMKVENSNREMNEELLAKVARAIYAKMDITDGLDSTAAETYARAAIRIVTAECEKVALKVGDPDQHNITYSDNLICREVADQIHALTEGDDNG